MKESDLIFGLLASFKETRYSFQDIAWLTAPFQVSETSLRTNLSRMVKAGTISVARHGKNAFYSFTPKAQAIGENVSRGFHKPDWEGWDNTWWGISISLPDTANTERYKLKKKIMKFRFALMHPGFYIRPYHPAEKVEERLKSVFENQHCKPLKFAFYNQKELEKVPEIWKVEAINDELKQGLDHIQQGYKKYDLKDPEQALIGKMQVGGNVVPRLFMDPLLPERFLPGKWYGETLRKAFREWDKLTTEKSKPYWSKIFENNKQ